jgi:hypothetical protein
MRLASSAVWCSWSHRKKPRSSRSAISSASSGMLLPHPVASAARDVHSAQGVRLRRDPPRGDLGQGQLGWGTVLHRLHGHPRMPGRPAEPRPFLALRRCRARATVRRPRHRGPPGCVGAASVRLPQAGRSRLSGCGRALPALGHWAASGKGRDVVSSIEAACDYRAADR